MPELVYAGKSFVYATDDDGIDHTTDGQFWRYILMRLCVPTRVIIYDTRQQMEAALKQKGLMA